MKVKQILCAFVCGFAVLGVSVRSVSAKIVSEAPGWTFEESERPSFCVSGDYLGSWQLFDWCGRSLGVAKDDGKGRLVFDRQLPGYYWAKRAGGQFSFCVTRADPNRDEGSFFAADSGFTECSAQGRYDCPWVDGDSLDVTAGLLGKCGVTHTRERIYWSAMERERGNYTFEPFLSNAEKLKANGVKSLGLFPRSPYWQLSPDRSLPSDLVATYRFMEAAAKAFDGHYDAWEFFNEQELGSVKEPSWEYAVALKAYALGTRAGSARTVVLPGSLSGIDHFGYGQNMFDAEISKYVQAFNLHTYAALAKYPAFHKDIRTFLEEAGVPNWQVWLTECGTELEGGAAAIDAAGRAEHSDEQEMIVAEFYPKSNVLHRFGGIARNWFFLFGCYSERGGYKIWGSMRHDGSVKPVHAAISAMTGELGAAEQLGAVELGSGVRAFLYAQKDGRQTLVFWSPSPVDKGATAAEVRGRPDLCECKVVLPVKSGTYRLVDMMGTPKDVAAKDGILRLVATRYPQYLTGTDLGLQIVRPSASVGEIARYVPTEEEDLTVIVRPKADPADFSVINRKSRLELMRESGRIHIEVWNLSDKPKCGKVDFSCGEAIGLPDEVCVPAWGKTDVDCIWTPPEDDKIDYALDIAGTFEGRRITRIRLPVAHRQRFLKDCESQDISALNNPDAWARNDSASSYSCDYDAAEGGVRFQVSWDGDGVVRWFYPIHTLNLPEESLSGVTYVEFEVKSEQDKAENDFSEMEFMLVNPTGKGPWLTYPAPGFNWEKRLVKIPNGCEDCTAIRVGANPRGKRLTYWIRNVRYLRRK